MTTLWEKIKAEIAVLEGDFTGFEAKLKDIFTSHAGEVAAEHICAVEPVSAAVAAVAVLATEPTSAAVEAVEASQPTAIPAA